MRGFDPRDPRSREQPRMEPRGLYSTHILGLKNKNKQSVLRTKYSIRISKGVQNTVGDYPKANQCNI